MEFHVRDPFLFKIKFITITGKRNIIHLNLWIVCIQTVSQLKMREKKEKKFEIKCIKS